MPNDPGAVRLQTYEFYQILQVMSAAAAQPDVGALATASIEEARSKFDDERRQVGAAVEEAAREARVSRGRRPIMALGEEVDPVADLASASGGEAGFLGVMHAVLSVFSAALDALGDAAAEAQPRPVVMPDQRRAKLHDIASLLSGAKDLAAVQADLLLNEGAASAFVTAMLRVDALRSLPVDAARAVERALAAYHAKLHRRHAVEGWRIHVDPVLTDVAIAVEENTDRHGEVAVDGRDPSEVSAYSRGRAVAVAAAATRGSLGAILRDPGKFIETVVGLLKDVHLLTESLCARYGGPSREVLAVLRRKPSREVPAEAFDAAVSSLRDLDPASIRWRDQSAGRSLAEREAARFREDTVAGVANLLRAGADPEAVIAHVLQRRAERRRREEAETVFYEARIGSGSPMLGVAPGALEVYPSARPRDRAEDVVGSGFAEAWAFVSASALSAELDGLFAATHPASTGERANVLLVGPPGCGKTAFLRALGARAGSAGIFVRASDFQTCWLGEASKNPARLFKRAAELAKPGPGGARRPAFILIDEIDGVLREPEDEVRGSQGVNLVNEFLQLLDGVVDYPGVRLCGATNHPERVAGRMLRRFQFVRVVGELSAADRARLLRSMLSCLPTEADERAWSDAAEVLEGAVGDVVRKAAESLWRAKMVAFAERDPAGARAVAAALREGSEAAPPGADNRDRRRAVAEALRPHFTISGDEIVAAARSTARDPAVRLEIAEAVASYERAGSFLRSLR